MSVSRKEHDALFAEIERIGAPASDPGETVAEIAARTGVGKNRVYAILQKAKAVGRLQLGSRPNEAVDESMRNQIVYRILPAKGKGKRK